MYQDTLSLSKFVEICFKLEQLLMGTDHKQVKYNISWFTNVGKYEDYYSMHFSW